MGGFLGFLQSSWIIFLILGILFGIGIAGFYVDKNTDILNIEKKKKELREKSMDVELLKSEIKDKSLSLGGTMGLDGSKNSVNDNIANSGGTNAANNGQEDLNVPLNLNLH